MLGTLKVSTGKLRSTATSFQGTGKQIEKITGKMMSLVTELSDTWSGEAATAYRKKFSQLQDDINRMISMINEHVTDLNSMAQAYDKAETSNTSAGNALAGDVIK